MKTLYEQAQKLLSIHEGHCCIHYRHELAESFRQMELKGLAKIKSAPKGMMDIEETVEQIYYHCPMCQKKEFVYRFPSDSSTIHTCSK